MQSKLLTKARVYNVNDKLLIITSFIISLYTFGNNKNLTYKWIYLLPLSYFVLTFFYNVVSKNVNYRENYILIFCKIVIYIRFVIVPFFMAYLNIYDGLGYGQNPSRVSVNFAIILMIIELLFVYITLSIAKIYYSYSKIENSKELFLFKKKTVVIGYLIISIPLLLAIEPFSILPKNILSIDTISSISEFNIAGYIDIFSRASTITLLFLVISMLKNKYDKTQKNKVYFTILAWLSILIYLTIIFSTSRWTILFSTMILISLMSSLFPNTPKLFYIILVTVIIFSLITISLYKFSWMFFGEVFSIKLLLTTLLGQLQEYFSGPRPVAQALEMIQTSSNYIDVTTLIADFSGSIPGLAKSIDQTNRINFIYNQFLMLPNSSQIIPNIGIGFAYFAYFPPIFTCIFMWYVVKFDFKFSVVNDIEFKYIYGVMGLYFAMSMGLNTQSIWGHFLVDFVPLWLLYSINNKIIIKNKVN